jgi:hypothetical protein
VIHEFGATACKWDDCTGEVQGITFQCENLRSGLNWLCLAMALLKAFFESEDIFTVKT